MNGLHEAIDTFSVLNKIQKWEEEKKKELMELAKVVQRMKQAQNDLNEIELMKEGDLHHVEKSYNDLLV